MKFLKTHYGRAINVITSDTVNIPNPAGLGSEGTATETVPTTPPTATSGLLTIGVTYEITTFETGDDFTNVGAASNANGVTFVATGTTPDDWTNGSELTDLSALVGNYLVDSDATFTTNLLGAIVVNTTDGTIANIVGFLDSNTVQLSDDIFADGDQYAIYNSDNNQGCSLYIPKQDPKNLTVLTVGGDIITFADCGDANASIILPVNVLRVTSTGLLNLIALW
jgi:hypothetical protein